MTAVEPDADRQSNTLSFAWWVFRARARDLSHRERARNIGSILSCADIGCHGWTDYSYLRLDPLPLHYSLAPCITAAGHLAWCRASAENILHIL